MFLDDHGKEAQVIEIKEIGLFVPFSIKSFTENVYSNCNIEKTSSPKGNDRSPDNKQVFLNSSQVSTRYFQLVKGS